MGWPQLGFVWLQLGCLSVSGSTVPGFNLDFLFGELVFPYGWQRYTDTGIQVCLMRHARETKCERYKEREGTNNKGNQQMETQRGRQSHLGHDI